MPRLYWERYRHPRPRAYATYVEHDVPAEPRPWLGPAFERVKPRLFVPKPETLVAARAAAERLGIADWLFGPDPETPAVNETETRPPALSALIAEHEAKAELADEAARVADEARRAEQAACYAVIERAGFLKVECDAAFARQVVTRDGALCLVVDASGATGDNPGRRPYRRLGYRLEPLKLAD